MNLTNYNENIFESIKHIDEYGNEYWEARELQKVLEYVQWRRFESVINRAIESCKGSNNKVSDHFAKVGKTVEMPSKAKPKEIVDYKLSRYACYLIVQNGDSKKIVIALGQTYFAIQTRRQEINDLEYSELSEDEKRLYNRSLTKKGNYSLNQTAKKAGVKNFDKFHNSGYKGLYNGETADDIAKRKGLRYREEILDNMCSDELAANIFRISQTNQKLKRENITGEENACNTHNKVGKNVRKFMLENGGIAPEEFPKPNKSIKEIDKKNLLNLHNKL